MANHKKKGSKKGRNKKKTNRLAMVSKSSKSSKRSKSSKNSSSSSSSSSGSTSVARGRRRKFLTSAPQATKHFRLGGRIHRKILHYY